MLGSSRVAAQLAASQEGLSSMSDDDDDDEVWDKFRITCVVLKTNMLNKVDENRILILKLRRMVCLWCWLLYAACF
jgi:hypothetical protein